MKPFTTQTLFGTRAIAALACAVGACLGVAGDVSAASFSYMNEHNFQIGFFGPPSLVPITVGVHRYSDFARAQTGGVVSRESKWGTNVIFGTGPSQTVANATTSRAWAEAHSDAEIHQTGPTSFAGSYRSYGSGVALDGQPRTEASAYSSSRFSLFGGTNLARGIVSWRPLLRGQVSGFGNAVGLVRNRDPLEFVARDQLTGEVLEEGRLVQIDIDVDKSGHVNWDDSNVVEADADDYSIRIDTDSPFVSSAGRGTVEFVVTGGVVIKSNSSGVFAALFPSTGYAGKMINVPLPTIDIDFDLNALSALTGRDYNVEFLFSNSSAAGVPEPATVVLALVGMGVVVLCRRGSRSFSRPKAS